MLLVVIVVAQLHGVERVVPDLHHLRVAEDNLEKSRQNIENMHVRGQTRRHSKS